MFTLVLYVILFIALSGIMAAVEAAILSVSDGEVEELVVQRAWGSDSLKRITHAIARPMVVVVVLTNTINVLGPILAGSKAIKLYGDGAIVVITIVLTLGTIVFSEIVPKSLGVHYAPLLGRLVAPGIQGLVYGLYPLVLALEWFSNLFKSGRRRIGTELQIRSLATIGRRAGYIESHERQLIRRAFILNDRTAADIMTPLGEMVTIPASATVREAAEQIFQHVYSRYPVVGKSIDEIRGLVLSRDILQALAGQQKSQTVAELCRTCLIVPADMKSDDLLVRFRDEHVHLAVVQDQEATVGLVTLEDVLEELVGEIEDEKDTLPEGSRIGFDSN